MILHNTPNTPLLAPQFSDMLAALAIYRNWKELPFLSMESFVSFMSVPSEERNEFLSLFTPEVKVYNQIAKRFYN
jgi:hypothetical protein